MTPESSSSTQPSANMMTDEQYDYVEQVNDELNCAICHEPFVDPISHNSCGNTFCSKCIITIVKCPMCSEDDFKKNCSPSPKTIKYIVDQLKVRCGMCKNIVSRGELKDHKEKYCPLHDAYKQVEQLKEQLQHEFNEKTMRIEKECNEFKAMLEKEFKEKTVEFENSLEQEFKLKQDVLKKQKIEFDSQVLAREKLENSNKPIHLNVRGKIMTVSLGDFINNEREPDNLFKKMFNGEYPIYQTSSKAFDDPIYYINCDPIIFKHILDWLQYGSFDNELNLAMKKSLLQSCQMFQLTNISEMLKKEFNTIATCKISQFELIGLFRGSTPADLSGLDLRKLTLSYYNLSGSIIIGTDFSGMNLKDVNFKGSKLRASDFSNCELKSINFQECDFGDCNFSNTAMNNVDLSKSKLLEFNVSGLNLKQVNFQQSNLKGSNFSNCLLESINFEGCDLSDCNFSNAIFKNVNLTNAKLSNSNVSNTTFENCKTSIQFISNNMKGSKFIECELSNTKFSECELADCNFNQINFTSTKIEKSKMKDCKFIECELSNTKFIECELADCNFNQINFTNVMIKKSTMENIIFEKSKGTIHFTSTIVKDCKFIECEISNNQFSECEISDCNFNQISFTNVMIKKSTMENIIFEKCSCSIHFTNTTFTNCKNIESKFDISVFEEIDFKFFESNIFENNNLFNNCLIKNLDLTELKDLSKFKGFKFDSCLFNFNQFIYKTIQNIKFENSTLENFDFKFIELNMLENNTLFNNCLIKNLDLTELNDLSKFKGFKFDSCLFNFNQFTNKTIENIKFENISFEEINFESNEFNFKNVELINCKGFIMESLIIGKNNISSTIFEETKSKLIPKLLYRGSRDGFKSSNFHSKCDNQGPTLTIIKSEKDQIFGGFTSQSWQSIEYGKYVSDNFAFIFKILNCGNGNYQFKKFNIKQDKKEYAIEVDKDYLPIFGDGRDFYIFNDCNLNNYSYSDFGLSYELPNELKFGSNETKSYLAGSYKFKVKEIEVFKIYQ